MSCSPPSWPRSACGCRAASTGRCIGWWRDARATRAHYFPAPLHNALRAAQFAHDARELRRSVCAWRHACEPVPAVAAVNTYARRHIFRSFAMSSSDRGRDGTPGTQREPAPTNATGADAYANWLDRMQRARARQAAITRNLYTWSNYKSWAEQVRGSWDATDSPGPNTANKPKK